MNISRQQTSEEVHDEYWTQHSQSHRGATSTIINNQSSSFKGALCSSEKYILMRGERSSLT